MSEPVSLQQLLARHQPAPAKHGALIRAAVRIADRLDIPSRLVMDLTSDEVEAGSRLFGFIYEAIGVGGTPTPSRGPIRMLALESTPSNSEPYAWLVKLARALVNSLSTEFTREEVLQIISEIEPVFDFYGHSQADVEARFIIETSNALWAHALFR